MTYEVLMAYSGLETCIDQSEVMLSIEIQRATESLYCIHREIKHNVEINVYPYSSQKDKAV